METIIVLVVIAGLFGLALFKTVKQRKKGGCSCSDCEIMGNCGKNKNS